MRHVQRAALERPSDDPYAAWASSYAARPHNRLMEVEQAAMIELLPDVAGTTVLDAGSGTGRYAAILRARGARRVVGLDRSAAMLARATPAAGLVRADLTALPFAASSFAAVVSGLAILDVPDFVTVVREWARVVTPGGVLVWSTLHPRGERLGWTRTFEAADGTRVLPACWHSIVEQQEACASAGVSIERMLEPSADGRAAEPVALVVRGRRWERA